MNNLRHSLRVIPLLWRCAGFIAFVVVWQMMSGIYGPLLVASPVETAEATVRLFASPYTAAHLIQTLGRIVLSLGLQLVLGIVIGVLAGFYPWLEDLLKPITGMLMSIPPVAVALIVIFILGGGTYQTVATATALGFPLLYGGAVTAVRSMDSSLLEMLKVYRVPKATQLIAGYIPAILYALLPSILLATGLTVRLMVMAEIIVGVDSGVGQALGLARAHMATAEIFAWMLVMVVTVLSVEGFLLHAVKQRALAWQGRG